jgi:alkylation response protein AidB-like acyl-CoA dehydrogenase
VSYVRIRSQFDRPVGSFQSVQHLLAWAATDRYQLACLLDLAVGSAASGPIDADLCEAVKALAGRVLHAVTQAAIQATGALSFTWEYSLNQLHRRGLALDQYAGASADLVAAIGRRVRTEGTVADLFALADVV